MDFGEGTSTIQLTRIRNHRIRQIRAHTHRPVYCSACGAKMTANGNHPECPSCGVIHWTNPAPAIGVAIVDQNGRVLLSKRARAPFQGDWDLIGGFIEPGESAAAAIAREFNEETGAVLLEFDLLAVEPGVYGGKPTLNLLGVGHHDGKPEPNDDSLELKWFPLHKLPKNLAWDHEKQFLEELANWGQDEES